VSGDLELRDDDSDDGITAPVVMPDVHLITGLWKIDGYAKFAASLQERFSATPNRNYFAFSYDWRRDKLSGSLSRDTVGDCSALRRCSSPPVGVPTAPRSDRS
jgi:hypothetical protein